MAALAALATCAGGVVACAEGVLPHRVSTSAIETAQDPAIETLFTDNLSQVNGCVR